MASSTHVHRNVYQQRQRTERQWNVMKSWAASQALNSSDTSKICKLVGKARNYPDIDPSTLRAINNTKVVSDVPSQCNVLKYHRLSSSQNFEILSTWKNRFLLLSPTLPYCALMKVRPTFRPDTETRVGA
ncbi:uncharacterized protein LOC144782636 isoform X2 [Lissotriton helveticus]